MGNFEEEKIVYYSSSSVEEAEETIEQFQGLSGGEQAFAGLASKLGITTGDLKRAGALQIWDGTQTILVERNLEDTVSLPENLILPKHSNHQSSAEESIPGAEFLPTGEPVEAVILGSDEDKNENAYYMQERQNIIDLDRVGSLSLDRPFSGQAGTNSEESLSLGEDNLSNSGESILGEEFLPTGDAVEAVVGAGEINSMEDKKIWNTIEGSSVDGRPIGINSTSEHLIKRGSLSKLSHGTMVDQIENYKLDQDSTLNSSGSILAEEFLPTGESVQPTIVHEDGYTEKVAPQVQLKFDEELSGAGLENFSPEKAKELAYLEENYSNLPTGNPVSAVAVSDGMALVQNQPSIDEILYTDSEELSGAGLENLSPEKAAELAYLEETEANLPVGSLDKLEPLGKPTTSHRFPSRQMAQVKTMFDSLRKKIRAR